MARTQNEIPARSAGVLAFSAASGVYEAGWPFCGDEYPPLKGAPGTVVCTRPRHPVTEMHLNEETGWAWPDDTE